MALCHATDPVGAIKETRSMIADHLLGIRAQRKAINGLYARYASDQSDYGRMMRHRLDGEAVRLDQHEYSLHVLADLSRGREPRV